MPDKSNPLADVLTEAAQTVAEAKLPKHLEEVAFSKVVDRLLGVTPPPASSETQAQRSTRKIGPTTPLTGIASKLGIDADVAERVFELEDDQVHILVAPKTLASNMRKATQELAYLVASSRQATGIEDQTATALIKDVCSQFGVLDDANFSKAITGISGQGVRISGSGQNRQLKINKVGYEKAAEIATRVASGDSK
jgi:hypothetical protein